MPAAPTGPDCSPTVGDREPHGELRGVGAGREPLRHRLPAGRGLARAAGRRGRPVWLSDRQLDGGEFGTTGIALAADRRTLLIGQGSSAGLGDGNPATGKIYAVEIKPDGTPGDMRQLWESGPTDLPDGFGVARSGRLYVPLAGTANQIAVVAPDGTEVERFPNSPGGGDNGSEIPFDTPSSARFLGTRIIVANQSFTGDRDNQALLDVEVGEPGLTELIPGRDAKRPRLSHVSLSRKRVRAHAHRKIRVRFTVSERARVSVRVERRARKRWSDVNSVTRAHAAGGGSMDFSARSLRAGRYRVVIRAEDGARNRSRRVTRRLRVR